MIGVTFALPEESSAFRSLLHHPNGRIRNEIITGTLDGREIAVCHTGVGPASAAPAVEAFLAQHRTDRLICAGFAGALDRGLGLGDIVIATNYSAPSLLERCRSSLGDNPHLHFGELTSQADVVETVPARNRLAIRTRAIAVDMETNVVARECAKAHVALLALRVISDCAKSGLPIPVRHCFDLERQRPRPLGVVRYLATHPASLLAFVRFLCVLPRLRTVLARSVRRAISSVD